MKRTNKNNEAGIVSIVIVVMLMIVISLIILGFSRLTRREQRQALDRELSTQAFYAAETGANDAIEKIKQEIAAGRAVGEHTTTCDSFMTTYGLNGQVDGAGGTSSFTCLFVDPTPPGFKFSSIDTNSSKIIPLTPKNAGATIDQITISWQDKAGGTNLSGCNSNGASFTAQLPDVNWYANCDTGVMRVDLVPITAAMTRDTLVDSSMTVFLYPSTYASAATAVTYTSLRGFGGQGNIERVRCNGTPGPEQCNVTINLPAGGMQYMMRLRSIYRASAASVTAISSVDGVLELKDGQAIVDITGKATDVLRRMQIRVPLSNFGNAPEFAAQTVETVCKRFEVAPPNVYRPDVGAASECDVLN